LPAPLGPATIKILRLPSSIVYTVWDRAQDTPKLGRRLSHAPWSAILIVLARAPNQDTAMLFPRAGVADQVYGQELATLENHRLDRAY